MNITENNAEINWTKKRVWGPIGFTHYAEIVIADDHINFTVDQPSKGQWIVRGWRNGDFFFYRDAPVVRTLASARACVELQVGELLNTAAAQDDELRNEAVAQLAVGLDLPAELVLCTCEFTDLVEDLRIATIEPGCPQHGSPSATIELAAPEMREATGARDDQGLFIAPDDVRRSDGPPEGWTDPIAVAADAQLDAWLGLVQGHLSGVGRRTVATANEVTRLFRKLFHRPSCGCPTPTHRMSCGAGATPRVVSS